MTSLMILLSVIGLLVLLGAIFVGLTLAGLNLGVPLGQAEDDVPIPDHLERLQVILEEQDSDNRELATVEGHPLTAGNLRIAYESYMVVEPELTEEEAIKGTILDQVDSLILEAEIEDRGLETTEEEARALVAQNRQTCEIDEEAKEQCRAWFAQFGFGYDEYWVQLATEFQGSQTALKAMTAIREEYLAREDTTAEGKLLDWLAIHEIRENADITWHDEDVEEMFEEAHQARSDFLESAQ